MIDEYIKQKAVPAARKAAGTALSNFGVGLSDWFRDFRWIEFTASVSAAFAAGTAMASSMALPETASRKVALFGAVIGAVCYIRSPKTKWETKNEPDSTEE